MPIWIARLVVLGGLGIAVLAGLFAATHLGISTDQGALFPADAEWRREADRFAKAFPQFSDLLVVVIDSPVPEAAEDAAAGLARALQADKAHVRSVQRPEASPFFTTNGLLFLDKPQLQKLLNRITDAQPFLGQLAADPSARGLFKALALVAEGVARGGANLTSLEGPLRQFHETMASAVAGDARPLSWRRLLAGGSSAIGGPYRFVLVQPVLDYGALEPGGAATAAVRAAIGHLEAAVPDGAQGTVRARITGPVALSDEEFATVAQGAVAGTIGTVALVTLWLSLAVRSWRLVVPILATLTLGLLLTASFAAAAVGTLNLISVAFAILFVGIAVDFGLQLTVRYREVRHETSDPLAAMRRTLSRAGVPIGVAAAATAAGFLAFVPTAFKGVAELGLIAGVGMLIALLCSLTFLPAALTLCRPGSEPDEVGYHWAAPVERWLCGRRWLVLGLAGCACGLGLALSPLISFDADPLHLKNPDTEAMRTLNDLRGNPLTNPNSIDVLTPSIAAAKVLAGRLEKLPEVARTLTLASFVPDDQDAKLAMIGDVALILGPSLSVAATAPPTSAELRRAAASTASALKPVLSRLQPGHPLRAIEGDLERLESAPDATLLAVNAALTRYLPAELQDLGTALQAQPVAAKDIPPEIAHDWVTQDGRARVQVLPAPMAGAIGALRRFAEAVQTVAPDATGPAVEIEESSRTIIGAFRHAALYAVLAIALILGLTLRRPLDVALVLAPLLLSAALTVLAVVALPLPLNFANIIALPLLLGVGVSFNIYFVMNWRAGRTAFLSSATARAILFSALTTGTAFGSLALSRHPGTASMGALLLVSLGCTLLATMIVEPVLLAAASRPRQPAATSSP